MSGKKRPLNPLKGKTKLRAKRKIDLSKALILRAKGMPYKDIAPMVGVSPSGVAYSIKSFLNALPPSDELSNLDRLKIPILKTTMGNLLTALNSTDKIEKASLNNAAYAFTQIYNALRLEEGKSTSNISYADTLAALKTAKMELKMLNDSNNPRETADPQPDFEIPLIRSNP